MAGIAIIVLMSCIALYGILKANYITLNILTIFVFFQNIVLVLASRNINSTSYNLIVAVKEFYIVFTILWSFVRKRRTLDRTECTCVVALVFLVGLFFVHSTGGLLGRLASLRQLYLPFVFYIFGKSIFMTQEDMKKSIRFFINMSVVCVIFGLVEMSLGDQFWASIGIKEYAVFKGFDQYIYQNELVPGAFYSYDFYPIIPRIRRMASLFADPVICGQILGIAFIIAIFYKDLTSNRIKRVTYSILLGTGLILSLAKGGILIAAISALMLMRNLWHKRIFSSLCIVGAVIFAVQYISFGLINNLSIFNHINGLVSGSNIFVNNIFGVGIGGFGNLGNLYSTGEVQGGESFIGAALGQIGIFAIIIYLSFYYFYFKQVKKAASFDRFSEVLLWVNIGLLITSFVNNTAISFTNCYIFYILPAVNFKALHIQRNNEQKAIDTHALQF